MEQTEQITGQEQVDQIQEGLINDLVDVPSIDTPAAEVVDDPPPAGTPPEGAAEPVIEPEVQTAFESYKDLGVEFPEDFKLEGLTKDQVQEKAKELLNPSKPPEDEDPFISDYKKAKEAGLTHEQYLQQQTEKRQFMNLNADDGLKNIYQNMKDDKGERLYTDEQIDEHLGKMTAIEKDQQWGNVKTKLQTEQEPPKQKQEFVSQTDEYNKKTLPELAKKFSDEYKEDILGIPFGEADKEEFNKTYEEMLTIDAESEPKQFYPSKLLEVMSDAQTAYELLYIHEKLKDGGIKNFINDAKEKAVAAELKKAGLEPQRGKSGKEIHPVPPPNESGDDFL